MEEGVSSKGEGCCDGKLWVCGRGYGWVDSVVVYRIE